MKGEHFSIAGLLPVLLLAALVIGFGVRLYQLDQHTITHPEMYVPGIALPDYVSNPSQRMSLSEVMLGSLIIDDPHPPGHHVMMLLWNRVFGTGKFMMRLTSVLAGTATLWVLFVYGRQVAGGTTAILATWMLALHGYHVYWSQYAKAWVVVAMLVVLSCWLLQRLDRKFTLPDMAGYVLVTAAGLWVEYFFWPLFMLQVLWVMLRNAQRENVPPLLGAQTLAFMLATPVIIYIYVHATGRASHLSYDVWFYTQWVLQFCGLLQWSGFMQHYPLLEEWLPPLLALAGALALAGSLYSVGERPAAVASSEYRYSRAFGVVLLLCAVLVTVLIVQVFSELLGHRLYYKVALILPWCVVAVWLLRGWLWRQLRSVLARVSGIPVVGQLLLDPLFILALGPVLLVLLLSLKTPLLSNYVLVTYMPLVLLLMVRGICRFRIYGLLFAVLLVPVSLLSVQQNAIDKHIGTDYQGFAQQLRVNLLPGDVMLVRDKWYMTPVHYYFPPDKYQLLPPPQQTGYGTEVTALPDRVWAVESGDPGNNLESRLAETSKHLKGFVSVQKVSTPRFAAILFEREPH
jgi:uncharacterized membrane protein